MNQSSWPLTGASPHYNMPCPQSMASRDAHSHLPAVELNGEEVPPQLLLGGLQRPACSTCSSAMLREAVKAKSIIGHPIGRREKQALRKAHSSRANERTVISIKRPVHKKETEYVRVIHCSSSGCHRLACSEFQHQGRSSQQRSTGVCWSGPSMTAEMKDIARALQMGPYSS